MQGKILIFGGLGNQLFQVAFCESLKLSYENLNIEYIDFTSFYSTKRKWELGFLNIYPKKIKKKEIYSILIKRFLNSKINKVSPRALNFSIFKEDQYDDLLKVINSKSNFIIDGYWQSEKYFALHKEQIKKIIKSTYFNENNNIPPKIQRVAVHIRRGDYVNTKEGRETHLVCNVKWYLNAIAYLNQLRKNLKFTVFTDDEKFVEKVFIRHKNVEIFSSNPLDNANIDLYEMSKYDHFIISNSSFSWWASFLGEKDWSIIIAPKYWFKDKETKNMPLFRDKWVLL